MNDGRRMALWTALAASAGLLVAFAAGVVVGVAVDDEDEVRDRDGLRLTLSDGTLSVEGLDDLDLGDLDLGDLDLGALGALGGLGDLDDLDHLGERLRERLEGLEGDLPRQGGAVLGVTVEEGDGGVAVARVTPGGPAEDAGVRTGDVIRRVGGERVETIDELRDALRALPADLEAYELELRRGDRTRTVDVERRGFVAADAGGVLGRLFGDSAPGLDRDVRPGLDRLFEGLRRDLQPRPGDRFEVPTPRGLTPQTPGVTPEQLERELERRFDQLGGELRGQLGEALREALAELVAAPRAAESPPVPAVPAPLQPERVTVEGEVFFGRVAEISADSIVLTGSLGPVTLAITPQTEFPAGRPALGDLVTAMSSAFVASAIITVG
jgi:hypothetical protein